MSGKTPSKLAVRLIGASLLAVTVLAFFTDSGIVSAFTIPIGLALLITGGADDL